MTLTGRTSIASVAAAIACVSVLRAQSQVSDRRLTRNAAEGERRLALVVGNNAYPSAPLRNAVSDARAVSAALRDVGFDVTTVTNADQPTFERAIDAFASRLQRTDIALFFYSGHGMQVDGDNYLIPIDFKGIDEADAKARSYSATRLQEKLEAHARIRVLILDACRDNPFKTSRSPQGGLSAMQGRGSLIAFATAAGRTASDNPTGKNGLFTEQFLNVLRQPGLSSREVFFKVRERVNDVSGGKQFPWVSDGLVGDFVFRPGVAVAADAGALDRREELALWETIGQSKDPGTLKSMLNEYLRLYPNGRFVVFARARLAEVSGSATVPTAQGIKLRADQLSTAPLDALVADCEAKHWEACVAASTRYRDGKATAVSLQLSASLAERACDGGIPRGCNDAGVAYSTGRGFVKDDARATALLQRACDGGSVVGCGNLARRYRDALGVAQDYSRAFALFQKACEGKEASACTDLGVMFKLGQGTSVDLLRAVALFQRGCDGGNLPGCSDWGAMLRSGQGVKQDKTRAVALFQRACDGGEPAACVRLGSSYEAGVGVARDMARAVLSFQRACGGGDASGCFFLAMAYEHGRSVSADRNRAIELYRQACGRGLTPACEAAKRLGS